MCSNYFSYTQTDDNKTSTTERKLIKTDRNNRSADLLNSKTNFALTISNAVKLDNYIEAITFTTIFYNQTLSLLYDTNKTVIKKKKPSRTPLLKECIFY